MSESTGTEQWAFAGRRCPFDSVEFQPSDRVVLCPECHTPHHPECWDAQGGCTRFGCTVRGLPPIDPLPVKAETFEISGDDRPVPCPYCGESIRSVARKCKHCGEYLDTQLRQQRAQYLIPVERELPVGARLLCMSEAAFGGVGAIIGLVIVISEFSTGALAWTAASSAVAALGIGLNHGREWARRANEVAVVTTAVGVTLACLTSAVSAPGYGLAMLLWALLADLGASLLVRSLRSRDCRVFCVTR